MPAPVLRDWDRIKQLAAELDSDGCTMVTEAYSDCCALHDVLWRTGVDPDTGKRVDYGAADVIFRDCIRERSKFGRFSPVALIRYWGVSLFGRLFRPARVAYFEPAQPGSPIGSSPESMDR